MTPSPPARSAGPRQQLAFLTLAIMGGLAVIGVVTIFVIDLAAPPAWAVGVVLAVFGAALALVHLQAGRIRPLPPGSGSAEGWTVVRTAHLVRMTVLEAPALAALVIAFLVGSWWVYAVGAAVSLVALAALALPRPPVLARYEAALNAGGASLRLGA